MNKPRRSLTWAQFWFLLFIVALISLAFPPPVSAEDITLSWTNPTQTEDCTNAGPFGNPGGTRIWQLVVDIPDPDQSITEWVIENQKPGIYKYVGTSYDDTGVGSRISGEAEKTVTEWVTIDTRVRAVFSTANNVILPIVGTVPLGTQCNVNVSITGPVFDDDGITIITKEFYSVDSAEATFDGQDVPLVVAECG